MTRVLLLAALLLPLALPPAAAAPLAATEEVWVGWQAGLVPGNNEAARGSRTFLASTHEFPLVVVNGLGAPLRNVTLLVEAPSQPFRLSLEGPDKADLRPNDTKPYAHWRLLPPDGNMSAPCPCGFALLHSKHSDDFSGGFEFVAHVFFERADGTNGYATSKLEGRIEGGQFKFQPWQVWLVGFGTLVAIAAGLWFARKRS